MPVHGSQIFDAVCFAIGGMMSGCRVVIAAQQSVNAKPSDCAET